MPLMPVLEWATDLAARSARLSASGEPMSGLWRALAHRDADAGAGEIDAAAGDDLAMLDEVLDRLGGEDGEVAARAGFELLQESRSPSPR